MIELSHAPMEGSIGSADKRFNQFGFSLIFISSVLLGIWATKDTIALRNILLVLGSLLSLIYVSLELRLHHLASRLTLKTSIPLILIGLMFCWVVFHFFFLSRYPELQFDELKSTWLRSFLAVILALGTGLAIGRKPNLINLLWLGILASFCVLFYQYIPIAIAKKSLFAPDWFGSSYIYLAKINGVLMGTILIAGLTGTLIDTARRGNSKTILLTSIYWFMGVFLALYSYVYIFMARNGIGLASLLFFGWIVIGLAVSIGNTIKKQTVQISKFLSASALVLLATILFGWLGLQHIKSAPGWLSLVDDVLIAVQIEKYPNWRDPAALGYPKKLDGTSVAINTYERAAWATAGTTLFLPENPLGLGVLNRPYPRLLLEKYGKDVGYIPSTHSAWIEFGLAFGYPGAFLLLISLAILIVRSTSKQFNFSATSLSISFSLLLMYTVGELSTAHAVEILFYWIAFLFAIQVKHTSPPTIGQLPNEVALTS
jgi:hypothetical protein